jgi:outer membrane protein assembly factor BamB
VDNLIAVLPDGHDVIISLNDDGYHLARFDARASMVRWKIPLLAKYGADRDLVAVRGADDGGIVYVADDSRLLALRLADGGQLWEAPLMAGVAPSCDQCVRASGDRLIVLEQDGALRSFEPGTGRQVWERKLANRPGKVELAGDKIVVSRKGDSRRAGARFELLDAGDGEVTVGVEPRCRSLRTFPDETASASSTRLFSPDGGSMFVQFGHFRFCFQRWDLRTGKQVWGDNFADRELGTIALLGGGALVIGTDKAVHALDQETGALRTIVKDTEHKLQPVVARADVVVVTAVPSWDSSSKRFFLWGYDPKTGQRLWQYASNQKPDSWSGSSPWWAVRDSDAGIIVLQLHDDKHVSIDTLAHRTGASAGRNSFEAAGYRLNATLIDPLVWVDRGSTVQAIDVRTRRMTYHVP